jgi:hypothetical protein
VSQEEEVTITVEDVIAGLADADKARRLDMFRLLHEAVSGDTRKAVSVGRTDAAWHAIHQAALFRPSWDGDQPGSPLAPRDHDTGGVLTMERGEGTGVDDLICLEALSCVWAISAHEENKPLVVLYGTTSNTTFFFVALLTIERDRTSSHMEAMVANQAEWMR